MMSRLAHLISVNWPIHFSGILANNFLIADNFGPMLLFHPLCFSFLRSLFYSTLYVYTTYDSSVTTDVGKIRKCGEKINQHTEEKIEVTSSSNIIHQRASIIHPTTDVFDMVECYSLSL